MRAYDAMCNGERYCINDPELVEMRFKTRELIDQMNQLGPREGERQYQLLQQLCGSIGDDIHIEKPLHIDYGSNIHLGNHVFINFNWVVLDCCTVNIGDHVFIGPNVSLYTAHHPLDAETRDQHIGFAEPITIGNHVWIGGNTTILPGVTIGDGAVIGAGSLVTRDIKPGMLAVGQPCREIRKAEAR
ncbi:sugar O-acetyltransferase [Celerinatantimonas sp. YJH-8]|uniref:sugar O-acetyltransferase n=1 Tax=Celerinatantimonas sp. YJH-8 TaxID=3228714 RepID=UPI0038C54640